MALLMQATKIENDLIINKLRDLRANCLASHSQYAVAAIVEIQLKEGLYAYVSGVNVENHEHNRLGMHAEQNAVAAAQTLFGQPVKFSKIWIMGAPANVHLGSQDALADLYVQPCGHCRQILAGHADKEAEIFSVTVNGKVSAAFKLADLLPNAFSESDFAPQERTQLIEAETIDFPAHTLLNQVLQLGKEDILRYFQAITPRVVNSMFRTSPIISCIIKLTSNHYIPGTLVQDIAFLTTDAIFSALGLAVTQFGPDKLEFEEVHLYADSLDRAWLTGSECTLISRFAKQDISIHFYTPDGKRSYKLSEMNGILN